MNPNWQQPPPPTNPYRHDVPPPGTAYYPGPPRPPLQQPVPSKPPPQPPYNQPYPSSQGWTQPPPTYQHPQHPAPIYQHPPPELQSPGGNMGYHPPHQGLQPVDPYHPEHHTGWWAEKGSVDHHEPDESGVAWNRHPGEGGGYQPQPEHEYYGAPNRDEPDRYRHSERYESYREYSRGTKDDRRCSPPERRPPERSDRKRRSPERSRTYSKPSTSSPKRSRGKDDADYVLVKRSSVRSETTSTYVVDKRYRSPPRSERVRERSRSRDRDRGGRRSRAERSRSRDRREERRRSSERRRSVDKLRESKSSSSTRHNSLERRSRDNSSARDGSTSRSSSILDGGNPRRSSSVRGASSSSRRQSRTRTPDRGSSHSVRRSESRGSRSRRSAERSSRSRKEKISDEGGSEKGSGDEHTDEPPAWTRCSPSNIYYQLCESITSVMEGTERLTALENKFETELLNRAAKMRENKPKTVITERKQPLWQPKSKGCSDSENSSCSDNESEDEQTTMMDELERKQKHPDRLNPDLWYNDPGEMNDGPLCRCSMKARRSGIRHGIYPGETHLEPCNPNSNNANKLYHYIVTMSPETNFLTKCPTVIDYDSHEFIFEGFSMFSHYPLTKIPTCHVIRFNIEYSIHFIEERFLENMTVRSLELFSRYLFYELLELVDLEFRSNGDTTGCPWFHFMPRFARALEDNGKELLSMSEVLNYLLKNSHHLVTKATLEDVKKMSEYEYQRLTDTIKEMVVTFPGKKPCSIRVDQLDRDNTADDSDEFPSIIHFGTRPLQLSYAGDPEYQKTWRDYVKYRHLLANKAKVTYEDRHKLMLKELKLQAMRTKSNMKRDVTVEVSSLGFFRTGIMCDMVQHAMLLPVLVGHLRFHKSLDILEKNIHYKFANRYLLQLALTHPSYRENFGTNPDHARNTLTNCGIRQPEYGDRKIHYMHTRKRGINTLINIMSRFGKQMETSSHINHNERLEFLGDAVVEFLTSIHLFHLFPDIEEGGLATYRAAIVQNQHLAVLAKKLRVDQFMLYAHGSDLCHDLELRHAMANCFEALMGALFLDGGIDVADGVFSRTLFDTPDLLDVWVSYPPHPLQEQEPEGDRQYIDSVPILEKLAEFEDKIGIEFNHIRLLSRAFTHRSVGYNNLTLGSNQRLEFLGDTVLQLVASEYLYKHFPEHHEGHLSLLRSSLVNNRTQSVVCDDLGMVSYAIYAYPKCDLKIKDRADLLEAFLGALYVDKDLDYCREFCHVCFFPRLRDFIMNQDWNDPKSKLQQCCLTLRSMDGGEPDIPVYRLIACMGPTNTRVFTVAVYFRGTRLATGLGHSIQQAEMAAANKALELSKDLFPQLTHQKRVIEKSLRQQGEHKLVEKLAFI